MKFRLKSFGLDDNMKSPIITIYCVFGVKLPHVRVEQPCAPEPGKILCRYTRYPVPVPGTKSYLWYNLNLVRYGYPGTRYLTVPGNLVMGHILILIFKFTVR